MHATTKPLPTQEPRTVQTKTFMSLALLRATTFIFGAEVSMMVGVSPPFARRKPASALLCVMNACVDLCTRGEFEVESTEDLDYLLEILKRQTSVIDEICSPGEEASFTHDYARHCFEYVEREARAALETIEAGECATVSFNAWNSAR